jgi:hypothetical protein
VSECECQRGRAPKHGMTSHSRIVLVHLRSAICTAQPSRALLSLSLPRDPCLDPIPLAATESLTEIHFRRFTLIAREVDRSGSAVGFTIFGGELSSWAWVDRRR